MTARPVNQNTSPGGIRSTPDFAVLKRDSAISGRGEESGGDGPSDPAKKGFPLNREAFPATHASDVSLIVVKGDALALRLYHFSESQFADR